MNSIVPFEHPVFGQLRSHVDENNQHWFCAKDIATALDYPGSSLGQLNNLMGNVPEEWKGHKPITTPGGTQEMLCLAEQGVYFFLGRSDKPKALPYQKWVAGEIMPAIRRTGGYLAASADATPEEILARAVLVAQDTIKRVEAKAAALEAQVEADRPKVIFAESVAIAKTAILIGEQAKRIYQAGGPKLGQNRFFAELREQGYLHKTGRQRNLPTQMSIERGLMVVKEGTRINSDGVSVLTRTPMITGKGQIYFVNKFLGGSKAPDA